jgi:hypothetical protein
MQLLQLPVNYYLIAFVFCATLASYNFHYILAGAIGRHKLSWSLFYGRTSSLVVLLLGVTGAVLFFLSSGVTIFNAAIAVLLTLVYSVPLLPFKQLEFARKAGLLKTILLAFTWMFVTAYLPMTAQGVHWSPLELLILAKRFLFMLLLCIIFDNRDITVDRINGLHSLATDLRPAVLQALILVVFMLLFILNFFFGKFGIDHRQVTALQVAALATLTVYFFSRSRQGYFFYYFVVDGMMILMTLLTTIASI